MKNTLKRIFSLLLCAVVLLSVLPTGAFATDDGQTAQESANEPETVSETETEVPTETETPDETETPTEPEEAAAEVAVKFVRSPEALTLCVYTKAEDGEKTEYEPEEDGTYLLLPGEYLYDASCEGYVSVTGEKFTVEAEPETTPVEIEISLAEESSPSSAPESTETPSNDDGVAAVSEGDINAASESIGIEINATNFPDENFRSWVSENTDTDSDGYLSEEEISEVTEIGVSSKKISDLTGIEYFTALTELYCYSNALTSLDVSNNTKLTCLVCWGNKLTSVDVSKNTALQTLLCYNCDLTNLNVSGCTVLTELSCYDNELTSLDVSNKAALTELSCYDNELTSLNISNDRALTTLSCYSNKLTSLDVSKSTKLTKLNCRNNKLTSLDVSKNTVLNKLTCSDNKLTGLDVSSNTWLTYLDCRSNQLTSLDVSNKTELDYLYCENNQLTSLDVSGCTTLSYLTCDYNQLTSLDVSDAALYSFFCLGNCREISLTDGTFDLSTLSGFNVSNASNWTGGTVDGTILTPTDDVVIYTYACDDDHSADFTLKITNFEPSLVVITIDETSFPDANFRSWILANIDTDGDGDLSASEISATTAIDVSNCEITSLQGIEYFTALTELSCSYNQLTSLDVSKNIKLTHLDCRDNQLTSLDVSSNTALTYLDCAYNQLTSLDVSGCTALTYLDCWGNKLTSLDMSGCTELTELYCCNNQLTSLNVSKNAKLTTLWCYDNKLTSLDVSGCTALTGLSCINNRLTSLDVSKNTALTFLSCGDNLLTELDVSNCPALSSLGCANNRLVSLDVSGTAIVNEDDLGNAIANGNSRDITLTDGVFDLSTLSGFNVSNASDWTGGTVDGTILTPTAGTVTYAYDCGKGLSTTFTLNVNVYVKITTDPDSTTLRGGTTLQLGASLLPENKTNTTIVWSLAEGSEEYASIAAKTGKLTAKAVSEKHKITVIASSADGEATSDSITLTIVPSAVSVAITDSASGEVLTGTTITLDLGANESRTVKVSVLPDDAQQGFTFKNSSAKTMEVTDNGNGTLTLTPLANGTATLTVTTADGTKKTAKLTVKVDTLPTLNASDENGAIRSSTKDKTTKLYKEAQTEVVGGKSLSFVAVDENGTAINNKYLTWSIDDPQSSYASIKSGKLTTKAVPSARTITVKVSVTGKANSESTLNVTIYPAVTSLNIFSDGTAVTGSTVALAPTGTLPLTAGTNPSDAMSPTVTWKSSNTKIATVANGVVTPTGTKTGTVTITAKDSVSGKSATVKVYVGVVAQPVIKEKSAPDGYEGTLKSGQKLTLDAGTTGATNTAVKWTVTEGSSYASVSSKGVVTAKTVYGEEQITVRATSKDAMANYGEYTFKIKPKSDTTLSILKEDGTNATRKTLTANTGDKVTLTTNTTDTVTWKSSNKKVATVDENGVVTFKKAGTAKITATAGKRTAYVTIKASTLAANITVSVKKNAAAAVASGKSITLVAAVTAAGGGKPTSSKVTWSITEGASYAKISSSGVLRANKNLTGQKTVKVVATSKDGSGVKSEAFAVTLYPIVTGVDILMGTEVVTNRKLSYDLSKVTEISVAAKTFPSSAQSSVTWTSGNKKVATVAADGTITLKAPGTAKITAKAADGSGKSASFTLVVTQAVTGVSLAAKSAKGVTITDTGATVTGGKSVTIKATVTPTNATNKKVTWSISGATAYASISSSGVLKTSKVTSAKTVIVTCTAKDGSGASATFKVTINP